MDKKRNRFPGAKPFSLEEKEIFYGRQQDIERLYELLKLKRMITLYAESGIGKSSLVNAGLIPKYQQAEGHQFIPVRIRFGLSGSDQSPGVLLIKIIEELNTHTALLTTRHLPFAPRPLENSLWYHVKLFERNGFHLLLVFDQLEEVFTYSTAQINVFKEQIFSLFSGLPAPIDQAITAEIEALETQNPDQDYLSQLNEAIRFINAPLRTHVLLVVREDKLGFFHSFTNFFPDILKDIYKLSPLSRAAAKEAIELPAQKEGNFKTAPFTFSPAAIEKLLSRLAEKNDTFDPFTIQLTCRYIEKRLVEEGARRIIQEADLPALGVIEKDFIDSAWKSLPPGYNKKADSYKDIIANKLIAPDIERRISVHESNWIPEEVVATLINEGLLKRDRRGEVDYIEISHDRLVKPLLEDLKTRLEDFKTREKRRKNKRRQTIIACISLLGLAALLLPTYFFVESHLNKEEAEKQNNEGKYLSYQTAIKDLEEQQEKSAEQDVDRYLDSARKAAKSNNFRLSKTYLDSANFAATDASDSTKLDTIARLQKKWIPRTASSPDIPNIYKIDVFYDERTLPQSLETAEYIVSILGKRESFIVRKKLLTINRIRLNRTWDIPYNLIRYEDNKQERALAESLVRSLNSLDALTQDQKFRKQTVRTRYKSPNYISIFVKN
jgi:hypothetical protein